MIEDNVNVKTQEVPIDKKLALTKYEAAKYSNIGINTIERLLKKPNCPFVLHVGSKKLIKREEFEEFIHMSFEISAQLHYCVKGASVIQ